MPQFLQTQDGLSIAFQYLQGEPPVVVFLPGFFSHMQGTKALWLEQKCRERGQAYLRFDYRGHGESGGRFENGTISDWLEDTLLVLDHVPEGPVTITRRLIEDGERHLLLNRERLDLDIPVRLIHGKKDADIPWETSQALQRKIGEERCELILVPDGEHRLSREQDLVLIDRVVRDVLVRLGSI